MQNEMGALSQDVLGMQGQQRDLQAQMTQLLVKKNPRNAYA
jgi:hypothetical protein